MDFVIIVGIAVGLAMDAFAVAVASGFSLEKLQVRQALRMALFFGGFQMLMPVVGWLAGLSLRNFITGYDHWVAFALLGFIGGKMIYESFSLTDRKKSADPFRPAMLLVLAIATSIDALAVGITFAFLTVSIIRPVLIIGVITFALSFTGVYLGRRLGHLFERKIELFGGVVLIAIGLKILLEHLLDT